MHGLKGFFSFISLLNWDKRKEALKTMYFAKLQNVPTSPRKMRLVADMIRGMEVNRALGVLKFSKKRLPQEWKRV